MISEIRIGTLSVADLAVALRFYVQGLGYELRARGPLPAEISAAWRIPAGVSGECALLAAPGSDTGMLRLVAWSRPGPDAWAGYARGQDAGHFALNYRVRDLYAAVARLAPLGLTAPPWAPGARREPPTPYHWVLHDVEVWDSMSLDATGALLDIYEIVKGPELLGSLAGDVSPVETMAIHVTDALRSRAFYEGLGYGLWYEQLVEPQAFLGMPPGSSIHNINLMQGGTTVPGRIELAQRIGEGDVHPMAQRAVPPATGYLSVSFETDDLAVASKLALALGATPVAGGAPVAADLPGLGRVRLAVFLGPDGEALELYQR